MRVAFYGRFSSDKQKDSSIDQQYRNCARFAEQEGWTITQRYEDRAVSGAKGEEGRPGYKQMLADMKAKVFDVLLIDDMSRLSRDTDEANKTRKRILFHGARLIAVSDGIDTSQKAHKLQAKAKELTNEIFLDQLKNQIKRGMIDQAEKCYWNGGRVYGYKLVPVLDPVKLDQYGQPLRIGTRLAIDPEQARWVQQIFQWYVDGWSAIKIVTELNRLNVPPPGASYRARRAQAGWNFLALHGELRRGTGLLNNRLYTGVYTWNRSYRAEDPDTGRTVNRWRDRSEWIEKPMPELRIVSDELWAQVHERRMAVSQGVAALRASERCRARSTGRRPKYLLSGLLTCGLCRKPFVICEATKYGCSTVTRQGVYRCSNTLRVERTLAEALLLEPIKTSLFTQEGYAAFHQDLMTALARRRHMQTRTKDQAAARLAVLELEIERLLAAIKAGTFSPSLQQALEAAERERARLGQDLDIATKSNGEVPTMLPDVAALFKRAIGDLANLGPSQVDKARGIIKDLVGGSIPLMPTETSDGLALTATLKPDYIGLLRRAVGHKIILVAVTRPLNCFGPEMRVLLQRRVA